MTKKRGDWNVNPSGLYAGIPGPASVYSNLGKVSQQVPRDQVVKDLLDLLRSMPLSDAQVEELYVAISNRARHRICGKCNHYRIVIGGKLEDHPSGDLALPKTFVCKECL